VEFQCSEVVDCELVGRLTGSLVDERGRDADRALD